MNWDTSTIVAVTGSLSAAIGGLLTFLATRGVDAWIKTRDQHMKERAYSDQQEVSSHEVLIASLRADLTAVRVALVKVQDEHLECVRKTGMLEGKCKALETLNAANEKRLEKMDREIESLREWRHTVANEEHVAGIKQAIDAESGAHPIVKPRGPSDP